MIRQNSIPINQIRAYNYVKQHVVPGAEAQDVKQVARNLIGLHSARLPTPFVTLYTRINNFKPDDLRHELYVSRNMIKLRCMRKTLHIVDLEIAPIVHQATLKLRLSEFSKIHKNIEPCFYSYVKEQIINLVIQTPLSSDEIVSALILKKSHVLIQQEHTKIIKIILKEMWENGILCYINESQHWGTEKRRYGLTAQAYPNLNLLGITEYEAQKKLIEYHIEKFGPVTENDISWWTGLGPKLIREHIKNLNANLISLNISGFSNIFYMFKSEFDVLKDFIWDDEPWVSLLAYEDPTLKGYYESRYRYIESRNYNSLFNQIGEARSSIVANGQVIGIWEWDKKAKEIFWYTFNDVKSDYLHKIKSVIQTFDSFFRFAH